MPSKDATIPGPHTRLPIPRPKSPGKVHKIEQIRAKNFPLKHDVNPYFNPRSIREKTFEEFMYEIHLYQEKN